MEVTKDLAIVDSRAKLVSSKCFLHMLKMFDCNPLDTHFNARPGRYLWPKQLDLLNIQTGHFLKPINDFDKTLLQIFVIGYWLFRRTTVRFLKKIMLFKYSRLEKAAFLALV